MYIYWENIDCGHMRKIPDNEMWELYCDFDSYGNQTLNLKIGEETTCICESDYWTEGRPKLDSFDVGEYFTEVVKAVFELVAKDSPAVIDLAKLQEQVMVPFWKKWVEKGYVEE